METSNSSRTGAASRGRQLRSRATHAADIAVLAATVWQRCLGSISGRHQPANARRHGRCDQHAHTHRCHTLRHLLSSSCSCSATKTSQCLNCFRWPRKLTSDTSAHIGLTQLSTQPEHRYHQLHASLWRSLGWGSGSFQSTVSQLTSTRGGCLASGCFRWRAKQRTAHGFHGP